jgi:hypothetical protein
MRKKQYDITDNKASSAVASSWSFVEVLVRLNKGTDSFKVVEFSRFEG